MSTTDEEMRDAVPASAGATGGGNNSGAAATEGTAPSHRDNTLRPVHKLSINLIRTYKGINEKYYAEKAKRKAAQAAGTRRKRSSGSGAAQVPGKYDDDDFNYILQELEVVEDRYVIKERIGSGSFGQVVKAFDRTSGKNVAMKIIKSKNSFTRQAKIEIELLEHMRRAATPENCAPVAELLDHFMHRGHQCLVFEMLGCNLYEALKETRFFGFSLPVLSRFAHQILDALRFLATDDVALLHCDLKPENVLLNRSARHSDLTVIDFGSSCYREKRMYTYIQSRFYRAPEVLMGHTYGHAIDMWSLGCMLVELHTGDPVFPGTDSHDQLRQIAAVLGQPPDDMVEKCPRKQLNDFFEEHPNRDSVGHASGRSWRVRRRRSGAKKKSSSREESDTIGSILGAETDGPGGRRRGEAGHDHQDYAQFLDLVEKMLTFRPEDRLTPEEALRHPFITRYLGRSQSAAVATMTTRSSLTGAAKRTNANAAAPSISQSSKALTCGATEEQWTRLERMAEAGKKLAEAEEATAQAKRQQQKEEKAQQRSRQSAAAATKGNADSADAGGGATSGQRRSGELLQQQTPTRPRLDSTSEEPQLTEKLHTVESSPWSLSENDAASLRDLSARTPTAG